MFISVIIPTYNRSKMLHKTVESFMSQTLDEKLFELIIANNNSTDDTQMVIDGLVKKYPLRIKSIFVEKQGVHYARNRAVKVAKGELLYFTDDDMIADKNVLVEFLKIFESDKEGRIATATGKVLPLWEAEPPEWIKKYCTNGRLSLIDRRESFILAHYDVGVYSCHQMLRRNILLQCEGFNPENTAGEWIGDGESGLNIKIREVGYLFCYNDKCVTHHIIPKSRMTQSYLNKRMYNQGNCDSYTEYRMQKDNPPSLPHKLGRRIYGLLFSVYKTVTRALTMRDTYRISIAWIYYYIARLKYDIRIYKDERFRSLVLKDDWLTNEEY